MIPPAGQAPSMIEMEEVGNGVNGRHVEKPELEDFVQVGPGQWAKKTKPAPATDLWNAEIHIDPIKNPPHYTQGSIECIAFIEDQQLEFHEATALQYIIRARFKGSRIQDMKKAIWYLNRKLELLERKS